MLVAGVDSSTQSTKVLLCQADDGAIVGQATAPHPDGTECDPELWWRALDPGGRRAAQPRRRHRGGGAAARHGRRRRGRPGGQAGPALERRPLGAAGGGADRGDGRPRVLGAADRERPDGLVHGHQAALAGRARTGRRRPDRARDAAARLAVLAAGRPRPCARHRPRRRLGHRLLLPRHRPLAAGAGRGRAGQADRAAAGRRPGRGRGPDSWRRGAVRRNRGQHGRGARPGSRRR